jgi:hypothetical protein
VLKKATFYSSSKNPVLIFVVAVFAYPPVWALRRASVASGRGWVGVKLILHVQRTSKVRRTPNRFFFNTLSRE